MNAISVSIICADSAQLMILKTLLHVWTLVEVRVSDLKKLVIKNYAILIRMTTILKNSKFSRLSMETIKNISILWNQKFANADFRYACIATKGLCILIWIMYRWLTNN